MKRYGFRVRFSQMKTLCQHFRKQISVKLSQVLEHQKTIAPTGALALHYREHFNKERLFYDKLPLCSMLSHFHKNGIWCCTRISVFRVVLPFESLLISAIPTTD